jgi:hypothetical protein
MGRRSRAEARVADKVKFNLDLPKEIPLEQQERAYSSPIWYNP